jgi:hypothetical protein
LGGQSSAFPGHHRPPTRLIKYKNSTYGWQTMLSSFATISLLILKDFNAEKMVKNGWEQFLQLL